MVPTNVTSTSYLLDNLHCPSCVARINADLLAAFPDDISWVSPNLVTSVVTVEHRADAAGLPREIKTHLEDAGFDISAVRTASGMLDQDPRLRTEVASSRVPSSGSDGRWVRLLPGNDSTSALQSSKAAHLAGCAACQKPANHSDDAKARLASISTFESPASDDGFNVTSVDASNGDQAGSAWRVQLSVGGMTCASCVNTITNELHKSPWVLKAAVNLVTHSATVDYSEAGREADIVDAIEDMGYSASLNEVKNLRERKQAAVEEREVDIDIHGIFCPRCPERICRTLKTFGSSRIDILREPSVKEPRLKLRYRPDAPSFTIRHILEAIAASDPSLRASIFHPPTLEEQTRAIRAKDLRELLWREVLTIIIAVPTFVFGIVYMSLVPMSDSTKHFLMAPWRSGLSRLDILLCALSTPVYFFAADVFHTRAIKEVRSLWRRGSRVPVLARFYKFGSMNMLISLGTSIAYISSVVQMIVAAASSEASASNRQFYFDSVVFLTLFLLAGRLMEGYAKSKTGDAVEALAKLRPTTACLVQKDGNESQATTKAVDVDMLETDDTIRVFYGASPPVDGMVLSGESTFDESSLTGESRLIRKAEGDQIFAGTINKGSALTVRVTGTSGKSMLDQIVDVVREGQTKRAPVERVADVITMYFVPVVTLIALVTWFVWLGLSLSDRVPDERFASSGEAVSFALQFAIAVFVIACPCGLALAAPTAIFVGGGIAAKHGILAKGGGEAFEKGSNIDCVVFDKTGTLTVGGAPSVTEHIILPDGPVNELDEEIIFSAAKAVEEHSSHPIAKAIVDFCGSAVSFSLDKVQELPGKGMSAKCSGRRSFEIAVGNESLMRHYEAVLSQHVAQEVQRWKTEAQSIALVAVKLEAASSWILVAALAITDPIRPEAVAVVGSLISRGTQVWMLSGDNATTARAVAERVGIPSTNVLAEVLPSQKADKIKYLQTTLSPRAGRGLEYSARRATVAMVGDGINDSPALTVADVGVAIGSGSDVAVSSADFVLATSNLEAVLVLLDLSRVVFRRIKFNFGWAAVYNLLALPIAAGCLYAVEAPGGSRVTLDPVWASLAMALSSISVVLSSLSLRSRLPWVGFRPRHASRTQAE
ncbi:hypothetical protein S40293_00761 [Stachybotrys chartarum IBT 40293]|nr:hypothetical protein S40293_00761 [Stachybotrys chartarum IBT 40293]